MAPVSFVPFRRIFTVHSERDQLARAARGDTAAFQSIWTTHRDAVYRFAFWVLQDVASAEDVTQECFLALLDHPARFDPARGSLRTFLLAIARNHCRRRVPAEEPMDGVEPLSPAAPDLATAELHDLLNAAVADLPPLQREALYLFEYEDLTLEESAALAGTDVGTFKSRLHRARQRLKRELAWLARQGL
jgi:RNA polymerase sigma-70 factor (ECF subfamily)